MFEYGGYLGLLLAAFGAATLLPMQSEAVLGGLLISERFWGLGSNGTESALKPSACPQTLVASG